MFRDKAATLMMANIHKAQVPDPEGLSSQFPYFQQELVNNSSESFHHIAYEEPLKILKRERGPFDRASRSFAFKVFSFMFGGGFVEDSDMSRSGEVSFDIHCRTGLAYLLGG